MTEQDTVTFEGSGTTLRSGTNADRGGGKEVQKRGNEERVRVRVSAGGVCGCIGHPTIARPFAVRVVYGDVRAFFGELRGGEPARGGRLLELGIRLEVAPVARSILPLPSWLA
jgi:hypothetical protein